MFCFDNIPVCSTDLVLSHSVTHNPLCLSGRLRLAICFSPPAKNCCSAVQGGWGGVLGALCGITVGPTDQKWISKRSRFSTRACVCVCVQALSLALPCCYSNTTAKNTTLTATQAVLFLRVCSRKTTFLATCKILHF